MIFTFELDLSNGMYYATIGVFTNVTQFLPTTSAVKVVRSVMSVRPFVFTPACESTDFELTLPYRFLLVYGS